MGRFREFLRTLQARRDWKKLAKDAVADSKHYGSKKGHKNPFGSRFKKGATENPDAVHHAGAARFLKGLRRGRPTATKAQTTLSQLPKKTKRSKKKKKTKNA